MIIINTPSKLSSIIYKDGFGIKYPTKVDIHLKKETKLKRTKLYSKANNKSSNLTKNREVAY